MPLNINQATELYLAIRKGWVKYDEKKHCPMIIQIMSDPDRSTLSAFCIEAGISETLFYKWKKQYPVFESCFSMAKMFSREIWEDMGRKLKDEVSLPGTTNNAFEYWKLIGWSRFGISKNSRIMLDLDAEATPDKHYSQILKQASEGCFTAGEIKQLMEAVNVGLNTHQVFQLQKQIDELTRNLALMKENADGKHNFPDKGTPEKDKGAVADSIR